MTADELRSRFCDLVPPRTSSLDPKFGRLEVLASWLSSIGLSNPIDCQLILFVEEQLSAEDSPDLPGLRISQQVITKSANDAIAEAIGLGIKLTDQAVDGGARFLFLAADRITPRLDVEVLVGALLRKDAASVAGLDGVDDQAWMKNAGQIRDEIFALTDRLGDPPAFLTQTKSPDIAAMAGVICQAAKRATPVVIVGEIATCAALVASRISHVAREWVMPAVDLISPAGSLAQDHLGRPPILDLGMNFDRDFETPIAMTAPIIDAVLGLLAKK